MQIKKSQHKYSETNEVESVKRKIFAGAISMTMSDEIIDNHDQNAIISAKSDDRKYSELFQIMMRTISSRAQGPFEGFPHKILKS
jgi:hypothetical protein